MTVYTSWRQAISDYSNINLFQVRLITSSIMAVPYTQLQDRDLRETAYTLRD